MAETTAIEWCDSTFNPWWGCTKISPACDHCYAAALDQRTGGDHWGNVPRRRTTSQNWNSPVRWQKKAAAFFAEHGRRRRVFCASMADVFDNQIPINWRADLWELIRATPDLDWLLLTKRPQNIKDMLPAFWDEVKGRIWLGTTVEDQKRADQNIPHLLQHDAAVRFVSFEPMLEAVDLEQAWHGESALDAECWGDCAWCEKGHTPLHNCQRGLGDWERGRSGIDWVIAGGESGPQARPSHPDWFRSLRDQCAAAGVPFLFKQWGHWREPDDGEKYDTGKGRLVRPPAFLVAQAGTVHCFEEMAGESPAVMLGVGKKRAGRLLDGTTHDGFPGEHPND